MVGIDDTEPKKPVDIMEKLPKGVTIIVMKEAGIPRAKAQGSVNEQKDYVIVKDGQYLCYSTKTHRIYFGSSKEDVMLFQNERQADNIAYDYRAKKTEYVKGGKEC